ncbi:MAG TPA: TIGR00282 family metallophosphoesterase [Bacillota bacterium]|nr:TIGR00282 family metallophosphoesterase [Bacillota bacterium]
MKILFIGDVVSSPGRKMVQDYLPKLRKKYQPHVIIINGENAAGGKGITEKIYKQFLQWGAHIVTLGNHAWDKKEIFDFINHEKYLIRPANFPKTTPGRGMAFVQLNDLEIAVINLQGRTFMPPLDDPFQKIDELIKIAKKRTNIIFLDFHAEATSEKQAMGYYVDGRVSAMVGTHTHIQTADERILPEGTGYITDVGMTGPYDAVLGVEKEAIIKRFTSQLPVRFNIDKSGRNQLSGVIITIDPQTGLAKHIERILINDDHPFFD